MQSFQIRPDPDDPRLSVTVSGIDHEGKARRNGGGHGAAADPVSECARDRNDDDHRRPTRSAGRRLPA